VPMEEETKTFAVIAFNFRFHGLLQSICKW